MADPVLSIVMPYRGKREIDLALAVTTLIDVWQIREYRIPPLYSTGVRYRGERCDAPFVPGACERFLTAAQGIIERWLDCDDLAPWRAAELIVGGELTARPYCIPSEVGWHCLVERADGSIEDPSRVLGMKG